MKIRNIVMGEILDAEWRTDHPASSYKPEGLNNMRRGD
jgi:hypothetical protein